MSRLIVPFLLAVALVGCRDRDHAPAPTATPSAPTATATSTATPTPSLTAPGSRRGLTPGANTIIDLALAHDVPKLQPLVKLASIPCGPQQGGGSPPACPAGTASGTPVEVLPVATCEGEFRPASAVFGTLEGAVGGVQRLTGVYRAPDRYLPGTVGEYVAVFSRETPNQTNLGVGLVIAGDRLVGVWFGCQAGPSQIVPPGTPAVFLPGG